MSNKKQKDLQVKVEVDICLKDVPPGNSKESPIVKNEEKLPPEELKRRDKILSEYTRLLDRYCEPHNKKSRWVMDKDLDRVLTEGRDMVALCNIPRGDYAGIAALSHTQIDDKDPLRIFVLQKGVVIINAVIFNHTKSIIEKNEGCMSFPYYPVKVGVHRYNKITVAYQTLEKSDEDKLPRLSDIIVEGLSSSSGHVFQHEISHLNGSNIYDADFKAESCEGLGFGMLSEKDTMKLYKKQNFNSQDKK